MKNFKRGHSLNIKGRLISLEKPSVMGILNLTPDSFYSSSRMNDDVAFMRTAEQMIEDGALFLDIGGQSTRPGASRISSEEELRRVIPAITSLAREFPGCAISIDTFYSTVAKEAIEAGAGMVNDISAGSIDEDMFRTISSLQVPYVLMHMQKDPKVMQQKPEYTDVVNEVLLFLSAKLAVLRSMGVNDVIIDPGFGFGKELHHNYSMLRRLSEFTVAGVPVLVGLSRKGMIQKVVGKDAGGSLNGTIAANMVALMNGAGILRVHDVPAARDAIRIWQEVQGEE